MATTNTYLSFKGNCAEAFNLYKSVFGGEFNFIGKFGDMPPQEGYTMSQDDANKIMHISLPIGTSILMGSDSVGAWAPTFVQGNNFAISIRAESKAEANKLYEGLSAGGRATMPMADTFWGDYFGMFEDRFGVNWMVSYDENGPN